MKINDIAKVCHNANRAYCQTIGDDTQVTWAHTSQSQRDSIIHGVCFHLNYPDATPAHAHRKWMHYKICQGWSYGPHKDVDLKKHPNLVQFDYLPPEEQAKGILFQNIVAALAPLVDEPF